MVKIYKHIENTQIHSVYDAETDTLIVSTNEAEKNGVIYLHNMEQKPKHLKAKYGH
ncbi:MAG: hypothetical protein HFE75_11635 [Firmicutes bacterium]|jgi:hypothetical protein|nr:hypothetical protein [Bacillota bacterium]